MPIADLKTLIDAKPSNLSQFKGLTAAYEVLLGGVPTIDGYTFLINKNNADNFGAPASVVFNDENIYINTINALYQGNPTAKAAFDAIVAGQASIQDKLGAVYKFVIPAANQSADGLSYFLSQASFYTARAAELGIVGGNGPAVVAFASLVKIAVATDIPGLGDTINDLVAAVADGSAQIPQNGPDLTKAEIADGANYDVDDPDLAIGQVFTLTENSDTIAGQPGNLIGSKGSVSTIGDDTIVAGTSSSGGTTKNNLGTGDLINGGTGFDTLVIIDDAGSPLTPTMTKVERVDIQSVGAGGVDLNFVNTFDVEQIWNSRSTSDVKVANIQNEAVIGFFKTNTNSDINFAGTVKLGTDVVVAIENSQSTATITGGDIAGVTTLKVNSLGDDNNNNLTVAGGFAGTELIVAGANGLSLGDGAAGATNFNNVTNVDATGLTGAFQIALANNNQNITFAGGAGATSVSTGNGNSTITTKDAADVVIVGSGDNTIKTGGSGDRVDILLGGNQTVDLGQGDDLIRTGSALDKNDKLEGGEGTDTLNGDIGNLAAITVNGDVDANVNGFERLSVDGNTAIGTTNVINLDNIDDIKHVTLNGPTEAGTVVQEVQTFKILTGTDATGGIAKFGNVEVKLEANLTVDQVGAALVAAGLTVNQGGEAIQSVTYDNATDTVTVTYKLAEGDTTDITVTGDAGVPAVATLTGDAAFGATTKVTDGVAAVKEVQTAKITAAVDASGGNFDFGGVKFSFLGNEGIDTIGQAIAAKQAQIIAASGNTIESVKYDNATDTVTVTYVITAGDVGKISFTDDAADKSNVTMTITDDVTKGEAGTGEVQTVLITKGTDADGGVLQINGVSIKVDANLTVDQLGVAIVGKQLDLIAGDPTIASVNYDTSTDKLTFTYVKTAGDLNDAYTVVKNDAGTLDSGATFDAVVQAPNGTDGDVAGTVVLDNLQSGGTVVLNEVNAGILDINVKTNTSADIVNLVLATNADHTGTVDVTGFETLNISTATTGGGDNQQDLGLAASTVTSVTVTGDANVNFLQAFAALTKFDGSATGASAGSSGHVVTTNATAAASLTGGADNDILTGGSGADTIVGGAGADRLIGRAGADTLTGGTGNDRFVYTTVADSQGVTVDTITDFTGNGASAGDALDFSAFGFGSLTYSGTAVGYGAVLTSLVGGGPGNAQAVFDTSTNTLYVDVNGDAALDNADMAINMTVVGTLHQSDFLI